MKDSPLKDQPEMQQAVEQSKRLLANQSRHGVSIWITWGGLFLMVSYGLWTAYSVFRQRPYASGYVLIGCVLFLAREVAFHRATYEMLFDGSEKFERILNGGYYQLALSIIWHSYVVGTFFFLAAIFSSIELFQRRVKTSARV